MAFVDFVALRIRHLRHHLRRRNAVGVSLVTRVLKHKVHVLLLAVVVICDDVQAASACVTLVNSTHDWQHVGNLWAVTRFIDSHARSLA